MTFASLMRVNPLSFQAPIMSAIDAISADIELTAEIVAVDPLTRTLTMNWYPTLVTDCPPSAPITMDIFMPRELFSNGDPSTSADADDKLVYRFNVTKLCAGSGADPSFTTVTNIISSKKTIQQQQVSQRATLQSYPFDVYIAQLVMYSRNLGSESPGKPVRITDSFGIAVNFEVSFLNTFVNGGQSGSSEQLFVSLQIQRSAVTKIFVVVVGVANWITAVAFLTISAATIVYRSASIYSEMFVVPIGTLFAFTSIRANLPGSPSGFGTTIDIYTILPVLIIMSFCSVSLLLTILYQRVRANVRSGFEITMEDSVFRQKNDQRTPISSAASLRIQPTRPEQYHVDITARSYAASLDRDVEERNISRMRTYCTI
ncbi:hypothetical protein CPC08DRAFT_820643 [Agrocybe pediades]|nr:hypothetical protein CPC08DRAFT_820643 [Agrocybe pediades]